MKKVFALALALAMVLSLGAVAFADNSELIEDDGDVVALFQVEEDALYKYNSDLASGSRMVKVLGNDDPSDDADTPISFGQTRYFKLLADDEENPVTDSKTVSGLKVTPKWTDGEDYVKSVEIVKKDGAYYVALTTTGSELDGVDLAGKIYLKGTSGTGDLKEKIDAYFNVDLTIEYPRGDVDPTAKKLYVTDSKKVYDLEDVDNDEYTIYFGTDTKTAVACAVTDVTNTEDILLAYSVDDVDAVVDAYPDANIDFVALTASFKKTAEVTVYADEDTFIYKVVDGKLSELDAEYDEWEEGFIFNAKTLGTYAISDVELDIASSVSDVTDATETDGISNPTTGAAA